MALHNSPSHVDTAGLPGLASASRADKSLRHVPELDSLRGVAALVVLLNHFHLAWLVAGAPAWLQHFRVNPLLWLLVDGHASVMLFFMLSGFVLMLPHLRGSGQSYPIFVVRRILRIYPTFWAALAFAALLCACFTGKASIGHANAVNWSSPPDVTSLWQHALLLLPVDIYRYDNPVWSLVHEARISLIFPLLAFAALRLGLPSTLALAALCSVLSPMALAHFEHALPATMHMTAWSYTLQYCGIFLLGAALARRREAAVALLDRLPRYGRAALLGGALLLYLYPVPGWHLLERGDLCCAVGAGVLLTFFLRRCGTPARLLRLRPVHFLGKISYSLYLVHLPVFMALCALLPQRLPFPWVFPLFLVVSLVAATLLHRLVEVPSIALSRKAGKFVWPAAVQTWTIPVRPKAAGESLPDHLLYLPPARAKRDGRFLRSGV